jgi:hypothetical protein
MIAAFQDNGYDMNQGSCLWVPVMTDALTKLFFEDEAAFDEKITDPEWLMTEATFYVRNYTFFFCAPVGRTINCNRCL